MTSGQSLFFPARLLAAGNVYGFRFSAAVASNSALQGSVDVEVSTLYGPMSVYPSGEGGRIWNDRPIALEVTIVDLDDSPGPALVVWDLVACPTATPDELLGNILTDTFRAARPVCFFPNTTNCYAGAPYFSLGSELSNVLDVRNIPLGLYTLHVLVAKDGRLAESFVQLELVKAQPSPAVRPLNIVIRPFFNSKPNAVERLAFTANITNAVYDPSTMRIQWSVLEDPNIVNNSSFLLTPTSTAPSIAFRPNIFQFGQTYTFEVQILSVSTNALLGRNTLRVDMNSAPQGNDFIVSPSSLSAFDFVSLTALGWKDSSGQGLRYGFSVDVDLLDGQGSFEFPLADLIDLPTLSVAIPVTGLPGSNYSVSLRLRVRDVYGGETAQSRSVTVLPSSNATSQLLLERLNGSFATGDVRAAIGSMLGLIQAHRMNSSVLPQSLTSRLVQALDLLTRTVRLTALHVRYVVRIVDTILRDDQSTPTRSSSATLLVKCIRAVSEAFQTETSWTVFSNQRDSGASELVFVARSLLKVVSASTLQRADLVSSVADLLYTISRTSVAGEFSSVAGSGANLELLSQILPLANLSSSSVRFVRPGVAVAVSATTTLQELLGDRVVRDPIVALIDPI